MLSNKMYRTIPQHTVFFLLLSMFWLSGTQAQPVKVQSSLDTNQMLIGDQIHLNLEVIQSNKATVQFPDMQKALSPQIELLEQLQPDTTVLEDEKLRVHHRYLITSFDTGRIELPEVKFAFSDGEAVDTFYTNPMALTVRAVQIDSTETIFDIKGPLGAPLTFMEVLPYILGVAGLVLIVLLVLYLVKRYRRRQAGVVPEKPSEPAHVIAFRELDKLREEKLWENEHIKIYYTRLTNILRNYLWHRYDIRTLERTTDEILWSLTNTGFETDELYKMLESILKTADLVKFAKYFPPQSENEQCLDDAYQFVSETKWEEESKVEEQSEVNPKSQSTDNTKKE